MSAALDRALAAVDELIAEWVGPAAQRHLMRPDNNAAENLREAIRKLAEDRDVSRRVGWGVFQEERTNNHRDYPSGYTYTQVSAIFEQAPPLDALKYCQQKRDGEFVICEVSKTSAANRWLT